MLFKGIAIILLPCTFLFSACSEQPPEVQAPAAAKQPLQTSVQQPAPRAVQKATSESFSAAAFLREHMPPQAMAYLRLPSLFGMLEVEGTIYDEAHQSAAYRTSLLAIQRGLIEQLPATLSTDPGVQLLAELIIEHQRSPLELVLVAPPDPSIPMPGLLASVRLDINEAQELSGLISRLVLASPAVKLARAVDASGNGMLSVNEIPVQLYFDSGQQRLFFISGVINPANYLQTLINGLQATPVHAMHAAEVKIDSSGQGLYAWFAPKAIIQMAQTTGQPWGIFLAAAGLSEADGIAFGAGLAGGKQRLRIEIEMPHIGMRRLLPAVHQELAFSAAGKLDSLMSFSLPGPDDLLAVEQLLASISPAESMEKYAAGKQVFEQRLGVSLQELLSTFGPELLVIMDEAGQYSALKIKDRALFDKILARLTESLDLRLEQRSINGQQFHHVVIPAWPDDAIETSLATAGKPPHPLLKHLLSLPGHAFWVEEGDYLVTATVPQILIDRGYISSRTPVDQWLSKEQKVDAHSALMLASTQLEGLPQFIYSLELQGLLSLADIALSEIDMFALPTARELGLAKVGAYSAKLDSSDKLLSLELSYDHNPAEILLAGNGVTGIAVMGILAAVAIPAYQDYTIRSRINDGLSISFVYRNAIADYYQQHDSLPSLEELDRQTGQFDAVQMQPVEYDADTGRLTLSFTIEALGEQNRLFLTPGLKDGQIVWDCTADIQARYLPAGCRQQ